MHYSFDQRQKEKKQRLLSKNDLEGLSYEERQYAQEQFRLLYAEQMSKLTTQLSHKKKIQDNLQTLDQKEEKNIKQQITHLKNKMAAIQEKRNKNFEEKKKHYKQNDERWYHKLKQIQNKFKIKNREAIEKAKQYRQESQQYWKSKQKKIQEKNTTLSSVKKNKINTIPEFNRSANEDGYKKKYFKMDKKGPQTSKLEKQRNFSKPEIDDQLQIHQEKSHHLQQEKEAFLYQKAFQKLQKIEKKRQIRAKKQQGKVAEPTKPRVPVNIYKNDEKRKRKQVKSTLPITDMGSLKSKQSLQKLIKDHVDAKNRLQQKQFLQRGQILEYNVQRNKKEKIKKMLKDKVHEMKINALKKENSKNNIIHT